MKENGAGACSAPVPLNQEISHGATARPMLKMIHWIIFLALRPSWTSIAEITWSVGKTLFPLLLGVTTDAKLDAVELLARRLSAARPDAKHPGKYERKAGK